VYTLQYTTEKATNLVPIEDMKDGMVVSCFQLLPTEIINVENVYKLAYKGLNMKWIAAKLGIERNTLDQHFNKTFHKGVADRIEHLLSVTESKIDEGDADWAWKMLNRLDPQPKDPEVVIQQNFTGTATATITDLNNQLLE
jgi:hypothetical protein